MGLVATWLSGIGLSSAVPTFQAAGIVTPDALAELDVTHFEALGISNADDRRKLFYLVQRIKLAVQSNKKKRRPRNDEEENGTVEEQVESVISKTVSVDSEEYNDSIHSMQGAEDDDDIDERKESKEDHVSLVARGNVTDNRRRSKRLAAKQPISPVSPRRSKENRITNNQATSNKSPPKTSTLSPTLLRTPTGTSPMGAELQSVTSSSDWSDEQTGEGNISPRRMHDKKAGGILPANLSASGSFEAAEKASNTRQMRAPETSQTKHSANNKITSAPEPEPNETGGNSGKSAPVSRMQAPRASRPQSRLPNPSSKTTRTGKQLSAIPSEKAAPMSPLVPLAPSKMEAEIQTQEAKVVKKTSQRRKSGRRNSRSRDSLDQFLHSEESDTSDGVRLDGDSDSERSLVDLPQLEDKQQRENGGFHTSDSALIQPKSRRSMGDRRRSSGVGTDAISRPSGGRRSLTQQRGPGGGKPKSSGGTNATFVHGGSEAESWRSQVTYLREDNDAEHELFGADADHDSTDDYDMRIRVIVRKRPVSKSEQSLSGGIDVIHPLDYGDYGRILVYQPKTRVDLTKEIETVPFSFDNVFGEVSTNVQIYQRSIRNLIGPFFAGQWSSIFAYGQTGSGKTYTMMGSNMTGIVAGTATEDESNLGLYYLAALDIFEMARLPQFSHLTVGVSLFEIYGGKLYDLLNARKQVKCLEDRNGTVCFPGLSEHPVSEPDRLMDLIGEGAANRSTGTTSRNADSSRSHAVLQLSLRKTAGRKKNVEHGRLTFIDLAGSERGADTNSSSRATRLEGAEINTSLLALKEVIRALATGGSMTHIPFRGSKLTQVLKDSFIGKNSRCCMIACISPDIGNCEQTLNTLRYSDRVKERNPESGALSPKYEQPTKVRTSKLPTQARMPSSVEVSGGLSTASSVTASDYARQDESFMTTNDDEESDNTDFISDTDTDVLDDLLATSAHDRNYKAPTPSLAQSSKRRAGEILVSEHRGVMSSMLAMVKNEMTLVNKVDADRDGLDDYLAQLEVIQETQLNLIEKLRGALHDYVTAAEGDHVTGRGRSNSEESFEDLRD